MGNKVVVFGDGHYNSLGLVRSLGKEGLDVVFVGIGCKSSMAAYSRYVVKSLFYLSVDEMVADNRSIRNFVEGDVIAVCGSDIIMRDIDLRRDEFEGELKIFNIRNQSGLIARFQDKMLSFEIAKRCGIATINTVEADITGVPDNLQYPCLVKGANSTLSTKGDMFVCRSKEEFCNRMRVGVKYLVQDYIEKEYELDLVGLSLNHGQNVYIPAVVRKIRDDLIRQSVYVRLDSCETYPDLPIKCIENFLAEIGYEGLFSVEFIKNRDKYYFLEINLRNDGCCYLYTLAGVNLPYLWYCYATGHLKTTDISCGYCKTPYFLMDFKDIRNVLEGRVGVIKWLYQAVTADAHFVMSLRDPMPCFVSLFSRMLEFVR